MKIERFEDIQSWQEARKLTNEVYKVTRRGEFSRDYGLRDQIRRASVSVMSNIAEGFGRNSPKDFAHFLGIANASCLEVQSHLYVALDLEYINDETFEHLYDLCSKTSRLIGGFIHYLKSR